MEPFFETQCHKCGIVDEAKFSYAGPHLKQICCECGAYIKFFDKKLIPDVQEIKLKIWAITGGDLERINEAKKKIEFVDNLTGLYQKIMYWRLYLHIRKQPKTQSSCFTTD